MNRDVELIDRRIVTHEAIIEALLALRSDFEAERRTVAETPAIVATALDIPAKTDRLPAEDARGKTKAPAKQQPPRPPAQHGVSIRNRIIEHLSNRAMSGSELAHATGYSQVSIYKALRRMRTDGIVATREESDRTKKNFLLPPNKMPTGACNQIAVAAPIGERASTSPAPGPSPVPQPVAVRRPPGNPRKSRMRPCDPPPPPGLSIRDQIINLLLVRPMTSAELIKTTGCIPNSVYDVLAKMRTMGVVKMRRDPADGARKNYLATQAEGTMSAAEPEPTAPEL